MKNVLLIVVFLASSIQTSVAAEQSLAELPAAQKLAKLKAQAMSADYRADIGELGRLHEELGHWPKESELAYLARYWSGFASWRMAINGANRGMKSEELAAHLKEAAADFYVSIRLRDDFADAYAAAALVSSWLAAFAAGDLPAIRERIALSQALLAKASALDPDNPRVLWARGGFLLFAPESQGGSIARAIDVYRRMLVEASRRGVDAASPLPDWGKPESLMSAAYAHLRQTPPDLSAARREAAAALELQPEWSYVRDNLLKEIDDRTPTEEKRHE
ncbi:MAG: hypothetical protein ABI837_12750 [Acidobacteriota bacterium]